MTQAKTWRQRIPGLLDLHRRQRIARKKLIMQCGLSVFMVSLSFCCPRILLAQQATIPNPQFSEVRATILEAVKGGRVPSMSVAVAKGGRIIWEESFEEQS